MAEPRPPKTRSPDSPPSSKATGSPTRPGKPLFSTVTGDDFGRSINWSKRRGNAVSAQIKTMISSGSRKTK